MLLSYKPDSGSALCTAVKWLCTMIGEEPELVTVETVGNKLGLVLGYALNQYAPKCSTLCRAQQSLLLISSSSRRSCRGLQGCPQSPTASNRVKTLEWEVLGRALTRMSDKRSPHHATDSPFSHEGCA